MGSFGHNISDFGNMPIRILLGLTGDATIAAAMKITHAVNEGALDGANVSSGYTEDPRIDRKKVTDLIEDVVEYVLNPGPGRTGIEVVRGVVEKFGERIGELNYMEVTSAMLIAVSGNISAVADHFGKRFAKALNEHDAPDPEDIESMTVLPLDVVTKAAKAVRPDIDWESLGGREVQAEMLKLDDSDRMLITEMSKRAVGILTDPSDVCSNTDPQSGVDVVEDLENVLTSFLKAAIGDDAKAEDLIKKATMAAAFSDIEAMEEIIEDQESNKRNKENPDEED